MKKITKLLKILKTPKYYKAILKRVAAGVEHEKLLQSIKCKTIVDVGTNRGQFSLAARRCFPYAKIFTFEPLPGPFKTLECIFANDHLVKHYQMAIGAESCKNKMHISQRDDSSSLMPITDLQNKIFPGTKEKSVIDVRVEPLDSVLNENDIAGPALLKIDVQGYELEVLKGSKKLISLFTYVYVECSYVELYEGQPLVSDVIFLLYQCGFNLKGVYNTAYDKLGRAVQSDMLFEVKKSV